MSGNKMKGRLEMSEIGVAASEEVVLSVVTHLKNGKIEDALAGFAEEFRFKDHGIGLEFKKKSAWRNSSTRHGSFTQILCC